MANRMPEQLEGQSGQASDPVLARISATIRMARQLLVPTNRLRSMYAPALGDVLSQGSLDLIKNHLAKLEKLAGKSGDKKQFGKELEHALRTLAGVFGDSIGNTKVKSLQHQLDRSLICPFGLTPELRKALDEIGAGFAAVLSMFPSDRIDTDSAEGFDLLWPVNGLVNGRSPGQKQEKIHQQHLQEYRSAMQSIGAKVDELPIKMGGFEIALLRWQVKKLRPLPSPLSNRKNVLSLLQWHSDAVHQLLEHLKIVYPEGSETVCEFLIRIVDPIPVKMAFAPFGVLSMELPPSSAADISAPQTIYFAASGPKYRVLADRLLVPAFRGINGEPVAKMTGLKLTAECSEALVDADEQFLSAVWQVVKWSDDPENISVGELLHGYITDRKVGRLPARPEAERICSLFGLQELDQRSSPRLAAALELSGVIPRPSHVSVARAVERIQQHLESLGFEFYDAGTVSCSFDDDLMPSALRKTQGLRYRNKSGKPGTLWPPINQRSAGPEPSELFKFLAEITDFVKALTRSAPQASHRAANNLETLKMELQNPEFYLKARGTTLSEEEIQTFADTFRAFIRAADELLYLGRDSDTAKWAARRKAWETLLRGFLTHYNDAIRRPELKIEIGGESEEPSVVHWCWSGIKPPGEVVELLRFIRIGAGSSRMEVVKSTGVAVAPALLSEIHPALWERVKAPRFDVDFQSSEVRDDLANKALQWARSSRNLKENLKDFSSILGLVGYTTAPKEGEKFNSRVHKVVDWKFSEQDPNVCIKVREWSLERTQDREWLKDPQTGEPVKALIDVSKGPTPALLKALDFDEFKTSPLWPRIQAALADTSEWSDLARRDLIQLGVDAINMLQEQRPAVGREPPAKILSKQDQLAKSLRLLDAAIVPDPGRIGDSWDDIEKAFARLRLNPNSRAFCFAEPLNTVKSEVEKGRIAELRSYACVVNSSSPELLCQGQWVQSRGPVSPQLDFAELAFAFFKENASPYFSADAMQQFAGDLQTLNSISESTYKGDPASATQSDRLLQNFLAGLDEISDLIKGDGAIGHRRLQTEILTFFTDKRGLSVSPMFPLNGNPPAAGDGSLVCRAAALNGDVQAVLQRRVGDAGARQAILIIGSTAVAPNDPNWQLIQNLYRELRVQYPGKLTRFANFFVSRDRYLADPATAVFKSIVSAAEAMATQNPSQDDRPELRAAIMMLDKRLEEDYGLRRVPVRPWEPFTNNTGKYYNTRTCEVPGKSKGLIVRAISPAYEKGGTVQTTGTVLITS